MKIVQYLKWNVLIILVIQYWLISDDVDTISYTHFYENILFSQYFFKEVQN